MKYLILGANGLIGQQFTKILSKKNGNFIGSCYSRKRDGFITLDLLDTGYLPALLDDLSPAAVINCTGLAGGVNYCEKNPEIARKFYVESTYVLADWCRRNSAGMVYFSSDCVFDGKNPPFREDDPPHPANLYGRYKLESEEYIIENIKHHLIIRTTYVYDWDPSTRTPNFLMQVYRNMVKGSAMRVPTFLFGTPTYAVDLGKAVLALLENRNYGLFHIVGDGYISRYEWAVRFCRNAGYDTGLILPVEKPLPDMVPRPCRSQLDTEKFRNTSPSRIRSIDEGLSLFIQGMKESQPEPQTKPT